MSNPNKTTRTVLRWTHLLIGVFVYTPVRESTTLVLLMQAAVIPTAPRRTNGGRRKAPPLGEGGNGAELSR